MSAVPQLHFDDGSRIILENQTVAPTNITSSITTTDTYSNINANPREETPIEIYYEIERITLEIVQNIIPQIPSESLQGFLCKVALQFPDELLNDSAQVAWLLEESIETCYHKLKTLSQSQAQNQSGVDGGDDDDEDGGNSICIDVPLVFVLGDTTYASCCPDEIGAQHLGAHVIVHFGQYACLSVSDSLPVIYSFGMHEWPGLEKCADQIVGQVREMEEGGGEGEEKELDAASRGLILVCERRYQNFLGLLAEMLEKAGILNVVIGTVPKSDGNAERMAAYTEAVSGGCCQSSGQDQGCCENTAEKDACTPRQDETGTSTSQAPCCEQGQDCCKLEPVEKESHEISTMAEQDIETEESSEAKNACFIGGLRVPICQTQLSQYTIVFIGDDSGKSKSRQFLNTILKCTSSDTSTKECWSYNPSTEHLSTDPMSILGVSRYLNRRFYLTQKAKMANIIGILVGTLSQDRFRTVVASVRQKIEESGRTSYTFVVGKINVAKLANFAEVECFVLVACGETSVLSDERDFHLPVITPTELEIALGEKEWGGAGSCNTDFGDFLQGFQEDQDLENHEETDNGDNGEDEYDNDASGNDACKEEDSSDDEPYFSMVSGTYVSKPVSLKSSRKAQETKNLESLPGKGQITEYKSEAAEFWKKREYKGLEAKIGKDDAKAAVQGQTGIASDYGK